MTSLDAADWIVLATLVFMVGFILVREVVCSYTLVEKVWTHRSRND